MLTELRIIAKGLGLHELFIKDKENLEHYIGKFFVPFLQRVSSWLHTLPWEQALTIATDFELLQARDAIRTAMMRVMYPVPHNRYLLRTYPIQSIALREIFQTTTMGEQAMLLIIWLAIHSPTSF